MLLLALIEQAAIVIGFGVVGADRDRLVEVLEGIQRLFAYPIDDAAAEICRGVILVERDRLVVVGDCQIELAGLAFDQSAIAIGLRVVRIEAHGLVEIGQRLVVASGLAEHRAAHVVGLRVVGIALDDAAQRGQVGRGGGELVALTFAGWADAARAAAEPGDAGRAATAKGRGQGDDHGHPAAPKSNRVGSKQNWVFRPPRHRPRLHSVEPMPIAAIGTLLFTERIRRTFDDSAGSKNAIARAAVRGCPRRGSINR